MDALAFSKRNNFSKPILVSIVYVAPTGYGMRCRKNPSAKPP